MLPDIQRVVCIKQLRAVCARVDINQRASGVLWHPGRHIIYFVADDDPAV